MLAGARSSTPRRSRLRIGARPTLVCALLSCRLCARYDSDEKLDAAAELIEKNLTLLGTTAIEDKLQVCARVV